MIWTKHFQHVTTKEKHTAPKYNNLLQNVVPIKTILSVQSLEVDMTYILTSQGVHPAKEAVGTGFHSCH